MEATLTIYFPEFEADIASGLCVWVYHDQLQCLESGQGPYQQQVPIWKSLATEQVRLVLPGELVTRFQLAPPSRSSKTSLQAAPYILEDDLSQPIDELIFVPGEKRQDGLIDLSVIEKSVLSQYLEVLNLAGFDPDIVVADIALLAKGEAFYFGHRALVATEATAFVIDRDALTNTYPELAATTEYLAWAADIKPLALDSSNATSDEFALTEFLQRQVATNLRYGEFRKVTPRQYQQWLKPMSWSLAASLVLTLAYLLVMGSRFHSQAQALYNQADTRYRELFPQDTQVIDIRRQMAGHLGVSTNDLENNALELIDAIAERLAQPQYQVEQLRYQSENGSLQIQLQAPNLDSLNQLQADIGQSTGLAAQLLSANANDAGTLASLRISQDSESP